MNFFEKRKINKELDPLIDLYADTFKRSNIVADWKPDTGLELEEHLKDTFNSISSHFYDNVRDKEKLTKEIAEYVAERMNERVAKKVQKHYGKEIDNFDFEKDTKYRATTDDVLQNFRIAEVKISAENEINLVDEIYRETKKEQNFKYSDELQIQKELNKNIDRDIKEAHQKKEKLAELKELFDEGLVPEYIYNEKVNEINGVKKEMTNEVKSEISDNEKIGIEEIDKKFEEFEKFEKEMEKEMEYKKYIEDLKAENEAMVEAYKDEPAYLYGDYYDVVNWEIEQGKKALENETKQQQPIEKESNKNQNNEGLAIYRIRAGHSEYAPTIALSEKEADSHVETYYDTLGITRDDYKKVTDLIEIKKSLYYENEAQGIFNYSDKYKDFAKKVDQHLIYHICDKFYTDDNDRQFFKQNKIAYDDNGFIQKIQPIGDSNWVDIKDFRNVEELEKYFSESKNVKQENEVKQQQPTEKENEVKAFAVVMKDLSENNQDKIMIPIAFETKEEAEAFIIKHRQENPNENANYDIEKINDFKQIKEFSSQSQNDFSMSIKIFPVGEFDETTKKLFEEHKLFDRIWQKDEAKAMFQLLGKLDNKINETALANNKFPNSKLHFEMLTDKNEQVNIDVPLGRNLFRNGDINKLIDYSRNDLKLNQVSQDTADKIKALMATNEKGEYVTKVNNHTIENMFNGGMEGLAKSAQSIGDEHLTAFVQGFASAYGFSKVAPTQEKVFDKNAEKQPNLAEKIDNLTQIVANQSKENSQEKQSKKSSEITQDEMNAIKEETNKVGNEVLNKGKKPKDKNISKPTDISM